MTVIKAQWDTSASVSDVWSVLADGWTYPSWVVGASRMRAVAPDWPAARTRLHHSVGLWPALIDDWTEVLYVDEERELRLLATASPFPNAVVTIQLQPRAHGCHLEMSEEVSSAPGKWIPRRAQELAVYPRNRECLRRLALLAERSTTP
ncbi:MAG: SRPBCC family protein [Rhodococcus sp. (in: high G+C Gram-positive bacteria)]|uniref:SRPBCC family protein n=1 Tax=Rhodococcus sp. TaxID=1831 RepID=UPI003BB1A627